MEKNTEMRCLTAEQILAFVIYPEDPKMVNLAAHIYGCEKCRDKVKSLVTASNEAMTEEEFTAFTRFLDEQHQEDETLKNLLNYFKHIQGAFSLKDFTPPAFTPVGIDRKQIIAAAGADEDAPTQAMPKMVTITLEADCGAGEPGYWRARIVTDEDACADGKLKLGVVDENGAGIPMARFHWLNAMATVKNGQALLPLDALELEDELRQPPYIEHPFGGKVAGHITQFTKE